MKKVILSIAFLSLTACGGGGDSDGEDGDPSFSSATTNPGIYDGIITPTGGTSDSAVAFITSSGKVAIVDVDTIEGFIGTSTGVTLNGVIYAEGTAVSATGSISSSSGGNLEGTYTYSAGGGTFSLVGNPNLYNRTSSLSKLEGTWVDTIFTSGTGTSTWVVNSDGSFSVSTTLGCNGTGSFSLIDSSKNEYDLSLSISNCPGLNGSFSGIAVTSDTFNTDDTISLVFSSGSVAGLSEPVKQ